MQVVAEYRSEQRAVRQQQAQAREVERCIERMMSQVAAKEHALDCEVHVVSTHPLLPPTPQSLHCVDCACFAMLLLTSTSTVF